MPMEGSAEGAAAEEYGARLSGAVELGAGERPIWKPEHRVAADRNGLRSLRDSLPVEWAIVGPMIPPARHGGRKRSVNVREVLNGIFYVLWTGCQWKALPKDLPPKSTVHDYLELWNWALESARSGSPNTALPRTAMAFVPYATLSRSSGRLWGP